MLFDQYGAVCSRGITRGRAAAATACVIDIGIIRSIGASGCQNVAAGDIAAIHISAAARTGTADVTPSAAAIVPATPAAPSTTTIGTLECAAIG